MIRAFAVLCVGVVALVAVLYLDYGSALLFLALGTVTHTITKTWDNGGTPVSSVTKIEVGSEVNISEDIPDSSTDLELACVIDVSQMKTLYIKSDKAMTLETNIAATPADTFTLAGGEAIIWDSTDGSTNPLGTDVTKLFATTASVGIARLEFRCGVDPTI